jgi:lipopolysaccharide transport system permease protein
MPSGANRAQDQRQKVSGMSLTAELRKLPAFRELIINFTLREIKAKYKQAFFGIAWALVQPVALMLMMTVIFSYIAKIPSDGLPYPLFVFAALIPWQFFAGCVSRGAGCLVNQAGLISKIYFPRESLVLASFVAAVLDFAITSTMFVVLFVWYGVAPTAAWVWLIPTLLAQAALSLGLMLYLAPLNAMYRDIGQAIPLVVQVWMYASPIMYPVSLVPDGIRFWYFLNPMAVFIDSYRSALLHGEPPNVPRLAGASLLSICVMVSGYLVFKRLEGRIADVA